MRLLVAGGAGFIGSHFIEYFLATHRDGEVVNVDALTYAAHPDTSPALATRFGQRYQFIQADIASADFGSQVARVSCDAVVNFAAETHVDRSILDPSVFVRTNVLGTENLLKVAREQKGVRLVQVSTDEVYGSLGPTDPAFTERSPLAGNSPYAASKAAADLLALACHKTYGQDVVITRSSNNYGPRQYPEKLLPLVIGKALAHEPVPIYGSGEQVRDWLHVHDHCRALDLILRQGRAGEVYNVGGSEEWRNIDLVAEVLGILGRPLSLMTHVADRPGHDFRYALSTEKLRAELGWQPTTPFAEGLRATIAWYVGHGDWIDKAKGADYHAFYARNYTPRGGT